MRIPDELKYDLHALFWKHGKYWWVEKGSCWSRVWLILVCPSFAADDAA